ncbi:MAG TPA: glycosyltransferase [Solirubrobacterales bacterium]|jgi:GT2 family glycosyltransferase|nr:glycosyltransferase [Solirubrobacterales bacterium]
MAAVSVIVHLEGGRERARRCLEALAGLAPEPDFEAIVVDDASPDLGELLAGLSGDVKVLRNERREGFLAAAEAGAAVAEAETLVLLRGAPLLAEDALRPLVETLADPECAAAACADGVDGPKTQAGIEFSAHQHLHPTSTHALALRRADAECLRGATGAAPDLELAAICAELARRGRVVTVASALAAPAKAAVAARRTPGEPAELTVVVPTLDATAPRVRACLAAIAANTSAPHQVVVVDNGSPPQGFTAPVNAGLRAVDTPYAVVMNDDVEVLEGWWEPLRATLDEGAAVVFPQTVEGAMRDDFAAWCFGLARPTLLDLAHAPGEFFDPSLRVWFQDTDLLLRLRALGRPPRLVRGSRIRHALSATVRTEDPTLRAWIDQTIVADRAAFERKHPAAVLTR